jgi:hypothetical protein
VTAVFWSKLWFFLIALAGALALTIALVLPRPAQRSLIRGEANRLQTACGVIHILLADDARNRVELAGAFARSPEIVNALESASATERLDEARMKQVRDVGEAVMKAIQGNRKPDFAMLIDRRGRVVARVRLDDGDFGDVAAGRPLIDDALAGYLRDDLWAQNGTMYFVSAGPVVKQGAYVGAVVLGHQVTNQLAEKLVKSLAVDMGFHLGADGVAGSKTIAFDHTPLQAAIARLGDDRASDCQLVPPMEIHAGADDYTAIVARLPGEAAARQAFYSVIIKRPDALGFLGTLKAVKQNDLSFASFPWILVAGGFLIVLGLGIGLMFGEADRPLRRLTADAVRLAKSETERMSEDGHGGKFGSIARSVNIHIDKLGRDAKSARKDLDQLLGPAPEGSLGTIDLLATALPSVRPGGPAPAVPPPPSEFRFQDSVSVSVSVPVPVPVPAAVPVRKPPARPGTPPPAPPQRPSQPAASPPASRPPAFAPQAPLNLDDDMLGRDSAELDTPRVERSVPRGSTPRGEPYFKQIFDQFIALKRSCNEPIAGLVYERFAEKLVKNRADLMAKTGCREVRFTVYVKDGKAALKATPVKDEA